MKLTIYWYSGTGNALWAAQELARTLGEAEVLPMTVDGPAQSDAEAVGLVFPVHVWGVPRAVRNFLDRLEVSGNPYVFGVAVNAGQVSRTLIQLKELCAARGLNLSSGLSLIMPSNYLPWGGPGPETLVQQRIQDSAQRLAAFSKVVKNRQTAPLDQGPLWQRLIFTAIYRLSFSKLPAMDQNFWTDEHCNGCGHCARICPARNIEMAENRPLWKHHCEQCLACIQWCPQKALQYGRKTPGYARYHHPEISAGEFARASNLERDETLG